KFAFASAVAELAMQLRGSQYLPERRTHALYDQISLALPAEVRWRSGGGSRADEDRARLVTPRRGPAVRAHRFLLNLARSGRAPRFGQRRSGRPAPWGVALPRAVGESAPRFG